MPLVGGFLALLRRHKCHHKILIALSGLSEPTRRLVKEARDRIYRDWFAYYEAHGIIDGPQRVGNAMLILPALKVCFHPFHRVCCIHTPPLHLAAFVLYSTC